MQKQDSAEKLYYTISEVSKMTGLEAVCLALLGKGVPATSSRAKIAAGVVSIRAKDIEVINQINYLRTKEKLTIAGARNKLLLKRGDRRADRISSTRLKLGHSSVRSARSCEELLKYFP